jgi:hypothetical protein
MHILELFFHVLFLFPARSQTLSHVIAFLDPWYVLFFSLSQTASLFETLRVPAFVE